MNIAFCYNVKNNDHKGLSSELDFDFPETINAIEQAIRSLGHQTYRVEADHLAFSKLKDLTGKIDLVFNIAEGLTGDARESQIPLFCEMLGRPYTHSNPTTHAISLNKNLTKLVVAGIGVRVPKSIQIIDDEPLPPILDINFPVIIKPNSEGSSVGVFDDNVARDPASLEKSLKRMQATGIKGSWLIEEYLNGREFTVAVVGNQQPEVLPIVEQKFDFLPSGMNHIASYELKWVYEDSLKDLSLAYSCPAEVSPELKNEIEKACIAVYQILEVRDCARLDFRLNEQGELYFLEINTLPGINPAENVISYLPLAWRTSGRTYEQLIEKIISEAMGRYKK